MSISVADKIFMSAALINFGGIFVCIGIVFHMAYTKMDLMLEHMKNSSIVTLHAPLRYGGPWGKLLLIGWIASALTSPRYYLKHGSLSIDDLANFPVSLRRRLVVTKWTATLLLAAMLLLFVLRESGVLR
ncbi:MAG: hypothetical protein ACRESJ_13110 [Pseudomonas sp.]|uniref:hypothetical protein n=1 Tax=Pseudomonas sp. TaxID=306 RepID=UPI003D6E03B0